MYVGKTGGNGIRIKVWKFDILDQQHPCRMQQPEPLPTLIISLKRSYLGRDLIEYREYHLDTDASNPLNNEFRSFLEQNSSHSFLFFIWLYSMFR